MTDRCTSLDKNRVLVVGHNGRSKMVDLRSMRGFLMLVCRENYQVGLGVIKVVAGKLVVVVAVWALTLGTM